MKHKFDIDYEDGSGSYRLVFKSYDQGSKIRRRIKIKAAKRAPWFEHVQGQEQSRLEDDGNGLDWIRPDLPPVRITYSDLAELYHMLNALVDLDNQYLGNFVVKETD